MCLRHVATSVDLIQVVSVFFQEASKRQLDVMWTTVELSNVGLAAGFSNLLEGALLSLGAFDFIRLHARGCSCCWASLGSTRSQT